MIDEDREMTNSKNNIILIGMPGSGKSTNGVILAKIWEWILLTQIF